MARTRPAPETYDLSLPSQHPTLGLLAASAKDLIIPAQEVEQIAHKPGTDGHPIPGVALRVVDRPAGKSVLLGRFETLLPGQPDWLDTGREGVMDADGFIRLDAAA